MAIAISHPHYYATVAEWAAAFEGPSTCTSPTVSG